MAITHSHYVKWIHILAWKAMEASDLSKDDSKTIGIFIGMVKKGGYISDKNTLLLKVVDIIDIHSTVKSTMMPIPKDEYSPEEKQQIRAAAQLLNMDISEYIRLVVADHISRGIAKNQGRDEVLSAFSATAGEVISRIPEPKPVRAYIDETGSVRMDQEDKD